jgi:hypothetical protein
VTARDHGTRARYGRGPDENNTPGRGCRCRECRACMAEIGRSRRRAIAYGRYQPWADPVPVREHVRSLLAAGMNMRRVANAAGVQPSTVGQLVNGRGHPRARIRPETAARILAVRPSLDHAGDFAPVDATGARRRLQALAAAGYSPSVLARRLGLPPTQMTRVMSQRRMTARKVRAIRALYDELWDVPPDQSTKYARAGVTKALRKARACGWPPPLAWDDDQIDNPDAGPAEGWQRPKRLRGEDLVEEAGELIRWEGSRELAAMRLGIRRNTLDRAIARSGRAS